MKKIQYLNTCMQIRSSESINTTIGITRHILWQLRKISGRFPIQLNYSESKIQIDRPSGTGALINCMGMYDWNNMNLIKLFLKKNTGASFFDIGANIGSYTILASEVKDAHVFSFEAHPETYRLLCENIKINNRTNTEAVQVAVSNYNGTSGFLNDIDLSTNKMLKNASEQSVILVHTQTLDDFCSQKDVWPSIVKIDVEGCEMDVLKGFTLGLNKTDILLVEQGDAPTISELLNKAGFLGPLWFRFNKMAFEQAEQPRHEDPVFIKNEGSNVLHKLKISIE